MIRISYLIVAMLSFGLSACAQSKKWKTVINKNNGEKLAIPCEDLDSITFEMTDETVNTASLIKTKRIYGDGSTYCAFTSLVKRNNTYYVAFREGETHVAEGDYGVIRILKSNDGEKWNVIHTVSEDQVDLRDPNLSVTPQGNLLLLCGARLKLEDGTYYTKTYYTLELNDTFERAKEVIVPSEINDLSCWIWRLTFFGDLGYGVAYRSNDGRNFTLSLVKTANGSNYELICNIDVPDTPSETRLRFTPDGTMFAMVRRAGSNMKGGKGYYGKSNSPYINWEWKELNIYLAGQDFIIDNDNIVCATRVSQNIGEFTSLYFGDMTGTFRWNYVLPSSGTSSDTAYAGLLDDGNEYWVTYYSMHETTKPSVYIAKIPKSMLPRK